MVGKAEGHHSSGHAGSGKQGGSAHHGSKKQDNSKGGATKESSHTAMPKWALDNRAKQLNPNNFRYRGGKHEAK